MTPEYLAQSFHDYYERLAPQYGYNTREETKKFNPETPNGRLMIHVCRWIIRDFNYEISKKLEQLLLY